MQYYLGTGPIHGRDVSQILQMVTAGLLANPARKFSVVEQAYFQIWFETQTSVIQAQVRGLVANKQLQFLNGGWSMHDEANPTYVDMLDNTALGIRNIVDNFGSTSIPTLAWQIDPFGHSAFQGVLSSALGGYIGVFWARESADFKMNCCGAAAKLERVWRPSPSRPEIATFQGIFPDAGYGTPGEVSRCDYPGQAPKDDCDVSHVAGDMPAFISDIYQFRLGNYRSNDIYLNFGDDFTWENGDKYWPYLDGLIDALNADKAGRFNATYTTATEYVRLRLATAASLPVYQASANGSSDFFPYTDSSDGHNLWTGYFTSRPSFKGFVRVTSALQQAARQLQVLVGGVADLGPSNPLFALERALGVAQHHDSVAGTAMQNVNDDYCLILENGRAPAYAYASAAFARATGYAGAPFAACPLANVSLCPALESGAATVAVLYNSLGAAAPFAPVRLPAGFPPGVASYTVYDAAGALVTAQLVPLSPRDAALRALYNGSAMPVQWLCFTAALPAAGFAAYFVVPSAAAVPSTHESSLEPLAGADAVLSNGAIAVTVSAATGWPSAFADLGAGLVQPLAQSWRRYIGFDGQSALNGSKQASGAYIFRPATQDAAPLAGDTAVLVLRGPVLNLTQHTLAYVDQETRVWAGAAAAELEWTVGPVDGVSTKESHEVITRYESGLATGGVWVTDSNCREGQLRVRNRRANYTTVVSEPTSSNYYPVNCLIRASSADVTVAVAVDRSEGGSSLVDGALELMVHRRMQHDDGRGVGEPLNEPGLDGNGLIVRGRHWLLAAPTAAAPAAYKALHAVALGAPTTLQMFAGLGALTPAQWLAAHTATASVLAAPLPANVYLTTLHAHNDSTLLLRLAHLYDAGEDAVLSQPATVNLTSLLAGKTITSAVDMTLPGTQPLAAVPRRTYTTDGGASYTVPVLPAPPAGAKMTIVLQAQEIRTLLVTVS